MNLYKISAIFNGKPPYEAFGGKRIEIEFLATTSAELKERFQEVVGSSEECGYTFDICYLGIYESIKEWGSAFIGQPISHIQPMYIPYPGITYTFNVAE
jgi:hypothetical protein